MAGVFGWSWGCFQQLGCTQHLEFFEVGGKILQKLGCSAIIMTWISPMDHDNHHNKRKRGSKTFRVLKVEFGGGWRSWRGWRSLEGLGTGGWELG